MFMLVVNLYAPNDIQECIVFFRQIMSFINAHAINKSKLRSLLEILTVHCQRMIVYLA